MYLPEQNIIYFLVTAILVKEIARE